MNVNGVKKVSRKNIEITDSDILTTIRDGMSNLYQTDDLLVKDTYFGDDGNDKIINVDFFNGAFFNNTKCAKQNLKCICKSKITKDGYNIYCDTCKTVIPRKGLFQNIQAFNDAFIKFGIIVNNNNYNAPLTIRETLLSFPLNIENFKDQIHMKKFQFILNTHNKEKIIEFITIPYKYYTKREIYLNESKKMVNEYEIYDYVTDFYLDLTNKLIDFYQKNDDIPFMNNKCYNRHIMYNLTELYQHIQNNKNIYLPIIQDQIKVIEQNTPYDCTNDKFIKYIKKGSTKNDYLVLSELYIKYIEWYNQDNINCTETILTKNEFKLKLEEHIRDNLKLNKWKYKQYKVNYLRIYGWKYVLFNKL